MLKISPESLTDCVRETFSTPSGQVTLEWLQEVYVNYRSQSLVQSASPNLSTQLGYRLGQQDVVLFIKQVIENGFSSLDKQESISEDADYE